ncbi:glycoside hydrolase family 3, partial [Candidatus Termititenax persephonae]
MTGSRQMTVRTRGWPRQTLLLLGVLSVLALAREYSPEEKMAQLFILGFPGRSPAEFAAFVSGNHWGGYIFYEDINITGAAQAAELLRGIAAPPGDTKIKPFLAVDMEGGGWQLAKAGVENDLVYFASPRSMARADEPTRKDWAARLAAYTKSLGFNLNLAPVIDVDRSPSGDSRSWGGEADVVIENGRLFLDQHQA